MTTDQDPMTTDQFLSNLWEFLTQWGPVALVVLAVLFLIVFGLVLTFIISTWRSITRDHREMDRHFHGRSQP